MSPVDTPSSSSDQGDESDESQSPSPTQQKCVDKRREYLSDSGWSQSKTSLNSFGSSSLENCTTADRQSNIIDSNQSNITAKKRKLDAEQKRKYIRLWLT